MLRGESFEGPRAWACELDCHQVPARLLSLSPVLVSLNNVYGVVLFGPLGAMSITVDIVCWHQRRKGGARESIRNENPGGVASDV